MEDRALVPKQTTDARGRPAPPTFGILFCFGAKREGLSTPSFTPQPTPLPVSRGWVSGSHAAGVFSSRPFFGAINTSLLRFGGFFSRRNRTRSGPHDGAERAPAATPGRPTPPGPGPRSSSHPAWPESARALEGPRVMVLHAEDDPCRSQRLGRGFGAVVRCSSSSLFRGGPCAMWGHAALVGHNRT